MNNLEPSPNIHLAQKENQPLGQFSFKVYTLQYYLASMNLSHFCRGSLELQGLFQIEFDCIAFISCKSRSGKCKYLSCLCIFCTFYFWVSNFLSPSSAVTNNTYCCLLHLFHYTRNHLL